MKNKIKKLLKSHSFIYMVVCFLLLIVTAVIGHFVDFQLLQLIDVEMLISVVAAFFLTTAATQVTRFFTARFEDSTKLTSDFDALVKKYEANTTMLTYRNDPTAQSKTARKKTTCKGTLDNDQGDLYRLPVGDVLQLYGREFVIHDDPEEKYTPPEFSRKHYAKLISAHDASSTFNQINLRVDDIYEQDNCVHCHFSRTTYFDSLVTNRAIDYKIGGVSVRDMCACGPYLDPLRKSPLSNHMGFNGMVETSDHVFVFIKRHKHVSVGKNTMQCSVAASLKAKRALNREGIITKEKITEAIISEIEDELNLKKLTGYSQRRAQIFESLSFENNVLYFYRDLMEGGKPQLMFYAKIGLSSEELKQAYTKDLKFHKRIARRDGLACRVDGYKMLLVKREDLRNIYIAPDSMTINGRWYPATPSAAGTVVMLIQAMDAGLV